ncbi:hypothetical protein CAOG_010253 [Capsaspora owczarzaki ATCC 30864]|uniref:Uncharacterized protein n=1 Tax=Capsaspora owczarzaki (strain ATCC 30864) TaxID=595528 RepID=A0A0D2WZ26_CAPO3|nr:hypothetical protein CAOG_010253 [Capsaspora owczarzaki ATCC 30864]
MTTIYPNACLREVVLMLYNVPMHHSNEAIADMLNTKTGLKFEMCHRSIGKAPNGCPFETGTRIYYATLTSDVNVKQVIDKVPDSIQVTSASGFPRDVQIQVKGQPTKCFHCKQHHKYATCPTRRTQYNRHEANENETTRLNTHQAETANNDGFVQVGPKGKAAKAPTQRWPKPATAQPANQASTSKSNATMTTTQPAARTTQITATQPAAPRATAAASAAAAKANQTASSQAAPSTPQHSAQKRPASQLTPDGASRVHKQPHIQADEDTFAVDEATTTALAIAGADNDAAVELATLTFDDTSRDSIPSQQLNSDMQALVVATINLTTNDDVEATTNQPSVSTTAGATHDAFRDEGAHEAPNSENATTQKNVTDAEASALPSVSGPPATDAPGPSGADALSSSQQ